ncbi:HupE/UreJ family protein [Algibacillus agarilyticus]|uniref:HupE/UreJ family protein n=1 Tax=Algibacillus agarilyticus TaxID=2234133 RepID=UPI000DD0D9FE|nr:HupE/UreJ family protein [Algibacillus agarilyticus]
MRKVVLFLFYCFCSTVFAHEAGVTDTHVDFGASQVRVVYTIPNNVITPIAKHFATTPKVLASNAFNISNNSHDCELETYHTSELEQIDSAQFTMIFSCYESLDNITISYYLDAADLTVDYKNFTRIELADRTQNITFTPIMTSQDIPISKLAALWQIKLDDSDLLAQPVEQSQGLSFDADSGFFTNIANSTHYFPIGVEHIVLGFDHLLFLLALLLLPLSGKRLFLLITTFTVAHSITLGIAILGWFTLPVWLVEAAIAASIVYIAIENFLHITYPDKYAHIQNRHINRLSMTFLFGLLHGFGFSFVLQEIGLGSQTVPALLFFNLGVEAGQLAVVLISLPLLRWLYRSEKQLPATQVASVALCLVGVFWLVERLWPVI